MPAGDGIAMSVHCVYSMSFKKQHLCQNERLKKFGEADGSLQGRILQSCVAFVSDVHLCLQEGLSSSLVSYSMLGNTHICTVEIAATAWCCAVLKCFTRSQEDLGYRHAWELGDKSELPTEYNQYQSSLSNHGA